MKLAMLVLLSIAATAAGAPGREPGVPVRQAQPDTTHLTLLTPPGGESQQLYGSRRAILINEEAARDVTARFRETYGKEAAPRIAVFVNRALLEEEEGVRLTGRTERFDERTTAKEGEGQTITSDVSGENTYAADEPEEKRSLADQQTEREIERLFGRVFRHGGATLADARASAALLEKGEGQRIARLSGRPRAALKEVADIAIEVLVSSRPMTVRTISGDTTLEVPDLQVTAIRLSDAAILGQAAASDLLGEGVRAAQVVRQFGVADITEATAFALMEDMLTGAEE